MRRIAGVAAIVLLFLSCQFDVHRTMTVTYSVDGTAASTMIVYRDGMGNILERSGAPPWGFDIRADHAFHAYLLAYNETAAGNIRAQVLRNGVLIQEAISGAANGLVSISTVVDLE